MWFKPCWMPFPTARLPFYPPCPLPRARHTTRPAAFAAPPAMANCCWSSGFLPVAAAHARLRAHTHARRTATRWPAATPTYHTNTDCRAQPRPSTTWDLLTRRMLPGLAVMHVTHACFAVSYFYTYHPARIARITYHCARRAFTHAHTLPPHRHHPRRSHATLTPPFYLQRLARAAGGRRVGRRNHTACRTHLHPRVVLACMVAH